MQYETFGKTGRQVSRIGFGGAVAGLKNYLDAYDPANRDDAATVIDAIETALELGINYFDTAIGYGDGASEKIFGEGLAGVAPADLFLATKVGFGDRDHVLSSLERSLKHLRRDSIDLLQIHGDGISSAQQDLILGEGGMLTGLREAKRQGLIRYIGFTSEDNNDVVYRLIESGAFDSMQLCYNFLFQHPYEPTRPFGSMLKAEAQNMGIAAMRTTTSGTFQRWLQAVNPKNTFDYTPALIQYVLSNPYVDVALIGMRTSDIVRRNVAICDDLSGRVDLAQIHHRFL